MSPGGSSGGWDPGQPGENISSWITSQHESHPTPTEEDFENERRWVMFAAILGGVIVLIVILGLAFGGGSGSSGSGSTQSISYKDGYVCGQDIVAGSNQACTIVDGMNADQTSADANCNLDAGSIENGDNVAQWTQGCTDGVNDALYQQAHPGA